VAQWPNDDTTDPGAVDELPRGMEEQGVGTPHSPEGDAALSLASYDALDVAQQSANASPFKRSLYRVRCGLRMHQWLLLVVYFGIVMSLSSYCWSFFRHKAAENIRRHFDAQCNDRIIITAQSVLNAVRFTNLLCTNTCIRNDTCVGMSPPPPRR
jgi:hypothetical protein